MSNKVLLIKRVVYIKIKCSWWYCDVSYNYSNKKKLVSFICFKMRSDIEQKDDFL